MRIGEAFYRFDILLIFLLKDGHMLHLDFSKSVLCYKLIDFMSFLL